MKKGVLLFAQSGGPTAVINASAAGVIEAAVESGKFSAVFAAHFGMDGIFAEDFVRVDGYSAETLDLLAATPASAFGSCRHKLPAYDADPAPYQKLEDIFRRRNVTCFVYNGGNDSMDTCAKIAKYFAQTGYDCQVIGVPKTVDNDLAVTDHCPGYGSAAKYIATSVAEISLDTAVYAKGRITICEIMGRDAGWLAASAAAAKLNSEGADLIYLPERDFNKEEFFAKALEIYKTKKRCLVALSEGIRNGDGYVGAMNALDSFNHVQLGGVAAYLADVLTTKYGVKTRAVELSLPQRAAGHLASKTDCDEARLAGRFAVKLALDGCTGKMVTYRRICDNPYKIELDGCDLTEVANAVKHVPQQFITPGGDNIEDSFLTYLLPLMEGEAEHKFKNGMPVYFRLQNN